MKCPLCNTDMKYGFPYHGRILCSVCYGAFKIMDDIAVKALVQAYQEEREQRPKYGKIIKPK